MRYLILISSLLLCSFAKPKEDATATLHKMYDRYHGQWYKTLRFIQETEKYRNDTLLKKETWYETIMFPNQFRIDFDKPSKKNGVIFGNDSAYFFKEGKLARVSKDENDLLFLLGGMYFAPSFQEVATLFTAQHYDLGKFHTSKWKGKAVYVIGADKDEEQANQVWIDKKHYNVVRFVKYENGHKQEGIFEDHVRLKGGWTETKATFYMDGKLAQVEKYHDYVADDAIDARMFVPAEYGKVHWYKD